MTSKKERKIVGYMYEHEGQYGPYYTMRFGNDNKYLVYKNRPKEGKKQSWTVYVDDRPDNPDFASKSQPEKSQQETDLDNLGF